MIRLLGAFNTLGHAACYRYDDLEPDGIRLLQILPGKGTDMLSCRIFPASLKNPSEFNTLSYTWDSFPERKKQEAIRTEKIYLNNRSYLITPNLLSALRFYRENYTAPLWVDFLCINQFNLIERGKQVLSMPQIFSSGSRVLVRLGDETSDSDLAIDFIERISQEPDTAASAAFVVETILHGDYLPQWRAVDQFWKRRW